MSSSQRCVAYLELTSGHVDIKVHGTRQFDFAIWQDLTA